MDVTEALDNVIMGDVVCWVDMDGRMHRYFAATRIGDDLWALTAGSYGYYGISLMATDQLVKDVLKQAQEIRIASAWVHLSGSKQERGQITSQDKTRSPYKMKLNQIQDLFPNWHVAAPGTKIPADTPVAYMDTVSGEFHAFPNGMSSDTSFGSDWLVLTETKLQDPLPTETGAIIEGWSIDGHHAAVLVRTKDGKWLGVSDDGNEWRWSDKWIDHWQPLEVIPLMTTTEVLNDETA